jgi:hypothetical protein
VAATFLALALAVPAIGWYVAFRVPAVERYPRARRIALAAVGAPPLFTLLGGFPDFQKSCRFMDSAGGC